MKQENRKEKLLTLFKNKKTVTFSMFLLFSAVIWLFIKLSKEYEERINVSLSFTEKNQERVVTKASHNSVKVLVKASGFQLFIYSLINNKITLDVTDMGINEVQLGLNSEGFKSEFRNEVFNGSSVVTITPQNVSVTIDTLSSKAIPVKSNLQLIYRNGFMLADTLTVTPQNVMVYGPSEVLDTLNLITTKYRDIEDLHADFSYQLSLDRPDSDQLRFSDDKVMVAGKVIRFSEDIIKLPVRFENVPAGVALKTFPDAVPVVIKGSLTDLKKLSKSDFDLVCDYATIDSSSTFIKTTLKQKPSQIEVVEIQDENFQVLVKNKK